MWGSRSKSRYLVSLVLVSGLAVASLARSQEDGAYPASKHGGSYMYNFYFPLAPSSTPWGARLVAGRQVDRGRHERIDLEGRSRDGHATELTYNGKYQSLPDVSLDGKRFVYSSTRGVADHFANLYVQPTTGGEPYSMTFFQHNAFNPKWSPDGEWIGYVSNAGGLPQLDMAAKGWYGGSTHVHMNFAGNLHNTLENLMMMSAAEDQDIVNEQVANKDNRILDYQYFVPGGGPHPLSTPKRVLVVGQEYRPPFYGHVLMFGMNDHPISPFTTGYEGTAIESLYPSNTDRFRNLHRSKLAGSVRTYAYTGARRLTTDAWFDGLRGGHAFVTTGPLVELTVNGGLPGDSVELARAGSVDVVAHVRSIIPLQKVLLIFNGQVVEEFSLTGDRTRFDLAKSYPVSRSGWFISGRKGPPRRDFPSTPTTPRPSPIRSGSTWRASPFEAGRPRNTRSSGFERQSEGGRDLRSEVAAC